MASVMPVMAQEKAGKTELNSVEIAQRVAILKRFRELLSQQRDRFRQYLDVLDKQKNVIEQGSVDDLTVHVELEEQIVGDIFAIQKVIDPLEAMYQASFSFHSAESALLAGEIRGDEVPSLRTALEELRGEAATRSARNRELLTKRMAELRQEMKALRSNPYAIHRPVYSQDNPALIDIKW
ncbi:MAG: flagellar export chaperone FlgN [Treponema sp.]|jgi:hypothetical protein|nr:flagellar export chaperone FlgN [Treponema sp.]